MSDAPSIGSIRLHDAAKPDLPAGLYRLTSSLQIAKHHSGAVLAAPPAQTSHINVTGPRLVLGPGEIAARHPPAQAKGAFGDRLPHVTLGRRTLPWERRVAADGTPWLAVLVLAKAEAELAAGTLRGLLPAAAVSAMDALDPIDGDPAVTALKVKDLATFRGVLPSRTDVGLLCHVRRVNVGDSALAGTDDDGWFAVVAANRLPLPGAAGTEYVACVVSLEGRTDVWAVPDGQPPPPLIVLHSWSFTSASEGGTFEHLASHLDLAPYGAPAKDMPSPLDEAGTLAVQRVDRRGEVSTVRYRGPLLGVAADKPLSAAADDISAAAAFELGRLLGAADGRFLRELVAWHRAAEADARAALVGRDLEEALAAGARTRRRRSRAAVRAATSPLTTAGVTAALAERLRAIATRPANLWQAHPAGRKALATAQRLSKKPRRARRARRRRGRAKGGPR